MTWLGFSFWLILAFFVGRLTAIYQARKKFKELSQAFNQGIAEAEALNATAQELRKQAAEDRARVDELAQGIKRVRR